MTTPTPQDIARAEMIIWPLARTWKGNVPALYVIEAVASALAAERSRGQAECERLREALRRILHEPHWNEKIYEAVRAALAQPATAETPASD